MSLLKGRSQSDKRKSPKTAAESVLRSRFWVYILPRVRSSCCPCLFAPTALFSANLRYFPRRTATKALRLELSDGLCKLPRAGGVEVGRRLIAHKGLWLHGISSLSQKQRHLRAYPSATSSVIMTLKPAAKKIVPMLECSPCDISGISSSTTT